MADNSDSTADRLARVEAEISQHRLLYLRAVWAGHDGEAQYHGKRVDELLGLWQHVRDGRPLAVT